MLISVRYDGYKCITHATTVKTKGKAKCDMHFIVADVESDRHCVQPIRTAALLTRADFDQLPGRVCCVHVR